MRRLLSILTCLLLFGCTAPSVIPVEMTPVEPQEGAAAPTADVGTTAAPATRADKPDVMQTGGHIETEGYLWHQFDRYMVQVSQEGQSVYEGEHSETPMSLSADGRYLILGTWLSEHKGDYSIFLRIVDLSIGEVVSEGETWWQHLRAELRPTGIFLDDLLFLELTPEALSAAGGSLPLHRFPAVRESVGGEVISAHLEPGGDRVLVVVGAQRGGTPRDLALVSTAGEVLWWLPGVIHPVEHQLGSSAPVKWAPNGGVAAILAHAPTCALVLPDAPEPWVLLSAERHGHLDPTGPGWAADGSEFYCSGRYFSRDGSAQRAEPQRGAPESPSQLQVTMPDGARRVVVYKGIPK